MYVEARVAENSDIIGKRVRDLDDVAERSDVEILGLTRRGKRLPGMARMATVEPS